MKKYILISSLLLSYTSLLLAMDTGTIVERESIDQNTANRAAPDSSWSASGGRLH